MLALPYRATLTEAGVILRASMRQIVIPWPELVSVERRRGGGWGGRLTWRQASGRPVTTSDWFGDLHRMLWEIQRRAPHVWVST